MTSISKHLNKDWPDLKTWPKDIGPQPTLDAVKIGLSTSRTNTAVGLALAMYARTCGSSDTDGATAGTAATGSTSASHRVKKDQMVKAGLLIQEVLGRKDGHQVVRISLPNKAKDAPKIKTVRKRTPKTKTVEKTA